MARQIYLGIALHNHQPVGNFPWVFEAAYRQAYLPMVEALEAHPAIRLSLHYSGPLLDWLREHHPDLIGRIAALAQRGQVEMMTGGYYEPILPIIPDPDKLGQIRKMNAVVVSEFGQRPAGLWLAERVWEPHLPRFLAEAGVEWTVVDDTHFKMVGLTDDDLFGYYVTEEQGQPTKVFATSQYLRYAIPWHPVEQVVAHLRQSSTEEGTRIAVMGDDGEKFGVWPGTYAYCWQKGWVENLFRAIEENSHWLHTIPLGEYARRFPPIGRIYLPTASYDEMLEWALPAEQSYQREELRRLWQDEGRQDLLKFLRGGFWRHFLVKYDEINTLHKKMLRVHQKVYGMMPPGGEEQPPYREAREELWRGQCNCPYWHGVFGGAYLSDVRAAAYRHLIAAEKVADRARYGEGGWLHWERTDFDVDGLEEIVIETDKFNLYADPADGGSIFEWDWRPGSYNLLSGFTRRPEAYHHRLRQLAATLADEKPGGKERPDEDTKTIHALLRTKEPGLERHLKYDRYRRSALLDHFLPAQTTWEAFAAADYHELGEFVKGAYQVALETQSQQLVLRLRRDGYLDGHALEVEKQVHLEAGSNVVSIGYVVRNAGEVALSFRFGSEWNFNLLGGGHNDAAFYDVPGREVADSHLDSAGELHAVETVVLGNRWLELAITLKMGQPTTLWHFPIESVSDSEGGFERVYQATGLLLLWDLRLAPGESWQGNWQFLVEDSTLASGIVAG